jgi:hypothetical protein
MQKREYEQSNRAIKKEKKDISRGVPKVKHTAVACDWVMEAYRASLSFHWFKIQTESKRETKSLVNIPGRKRRMAIGLEKWPTIARNSRLGLLS